MNIHEHCLLSQRKFGGQPADYEDVHAFLDSSKYFFYHIKHRVLLHNLLGVEWATRLLGNTITNSDGKILLVRDIAVEHCREDLDGQIPTLNEWFAGNEPLDFFFEAEPVAGLPEKVQTFLLEPFLRTGLKRSLVITYSDFGVFLTEHFFGLEAANKLAAQLPFEHKVKNLLGHFQFTAPWQYTPQQQEIEWLKSQANGQKEKHVKFPK